MDNTEIKMQKVVVDNLLAHNKLTDSKIDALIGGDLVNQISISSYNAAKYRIPYLGFIAYFVSSYRIVIFFAYVLILVSTFLLYRSISKRKSDYGKRRRNTYGIKQYC